MSTSHPKAPRALTLDLLENAFLGSDFFPVRTPRGDGLHATQDGVIFATVRLVGNAIIVEQVGTGKAAEARAKRVAKMLKDKAHSAAAGRARLMCAGCGKAVQRGGIVLHRADGSSATYHKACFHAHMERQKGRFEDFEESAYDAEIPADATCVWCNERGTADDPLELYSPTADAYIHRRSCREAFDEATNDQEES